MTPERSPRRELHGSDSDIGTAPDIATASDAYASRFAGAAGRYILETQSTVMGAMLEPYKGNSLLEVGAGHGQLLHTYRDVGVRAILHGSTSDSLSSLIAEGRRDECIVSDIARLPFADRSFDVVVAIRLLPHLIDWKGAIAELCRVARRAVIMDYPSRRSLNVMAPMLFRLKKKVEGNTRRFHLFTDAEISQCLVREGFEPDQEERQFFLPMALHRLAGAHSGARLAETVSRWLGLTRGLGSPVILRAVRQDLSRTYRQDT
jgi:ubiquinone/menaquinone biosynthesis C-methylase UbiE